MKKIAIFVEGETESEFVAKLLTELAGVRNITLKQYKLEGGGSRSGLPRTLRLVAEVLEPNAAFEVLIYNSSTDSQVTADIRDRYNTLSTQFDKILGLRDLRGDEGGRALTLADLPNIENSITNFTLKGLDRIPTNIVIAVMEIETWFLAETNHYSYIDPSITENHVLSNTSTLGFNPYTDDLTLRTQPAEDLNNLYKIGRIKRSYTKKANQRKRTINCIDYANMYLNTPLKLAKLKEFIDHIDDFLSLS
jgi:hypothetical protein